MVADLAHRPMTVDLAVAFHRCPAGDWLSPAIDPGMAPDPTRVADHGRADRWVDGVRPDPARSSVGFDPGA
jgi:hypothetical protein